MLTHGPFFASVCTRLCQYVIWGFGNGLKKRRKTKTQVAQNPESIEPQGFPVCIFFGNKRHVGASFIALAPTFVTKVRARSCRCSSFPNRTRFAGLQFSFGCKLGNCGIYTVSIFQKERHTKRCVSLFGDADPNGICITCGQVLSNVRETLEEGELEPQIY